MKHEHLKVSICCCFSDFHNIFALEKYSASVCLECARIHTWHMVACYKVYAPPCFHLKPLPAKTGPFASGTVTAISVDALPSSPLMVTCAVN